jgi:guanylate kinase
MNRKGILFIISAPSGAGKTSLCKEIIKIVPNLDYSISYTTREKRYGEIDGKDYYFITEEKFRKMIDSNIFAEWAEVYGNKYGTSLFTLEECEKKGIDLILDIDTKGAKNIKERYNRGVYIFLLPPSFEDLRERLIKRGTDDIEGIEKRLKDALIEINDIYIYDYVIINNDLEKALTSLKSIIIAERHRRERVINYIDNILNSFREGLNGKDYNRRCPKESKQ